MPEIDDIINDVKPAEASTDLCLRGDLLSEYDRLREQLDQFDEWEPSGFSDVDPRTEIRARLAALRAEMQESTRTFKFRSIGDQASSDLLVKHPAPKNEQGVEEYAWDPQTYPCALVAASAVDPVMTEDQAKRLFDKLNLAQRNRLFGAAHRANNREVDIPFTGAAFVPAASTGQS